MWMRSMMNKLFKFIRPRWMFEASTETQREFSLDDPDLLKKLWEWTADGFRFDGSWRDVHARNIGPEEWNAFVPNLRKPGRILSFRVGDVEQDLESFGFATLRKRQYEDSVLLSVMFDGHWANFHFFSGTDIEFDIDPRDVNEANFSSLFDFMAEMSTVVGQPVIVTDESDRYDAFLFKIDTARRVVIVPVPAYVSYV